MLGVHITLHAARLIFANPGAALRIGLIPSLIALLASALAILVFGAPVRQTILIGEIGQSGQTEFFLVVLIAALIWLAAMMWIFVNWHRFVLLAQYPQGWVPPFPKKAIGLYFGRALQLFGMFIVLGIVLAIILLVIGVDASALANLLISIAVGYLFYRVCAILPAAAIQRSIGVGTAWEATSRGVGALFVVAVVMAGLQSLLAYVPALIMPLSLSLAVAAQVLVSVTMSMVQVSIVTTIYGHFYEDRPLG